MRKNGEYSMSFDCPFCNKVYENPDTIGKHVKRKHGAQLRLNLQNGQLERLKLNIIGHKITKIPDSFNIPSEYLGAFNAIGWKEIPSHSID